MNERIYIDGNKDKPTIRSDDDLSDRETIVVMNESWIRETTLTENTDSGKRITYPDGRVIEQ